MAEQTNNTGIEYETTTIESPLGKIIITGPKGTTAKIETTETKTLEYCNCDESKCPHCGKKKKPHNPFGDLWFDPGMFGRPHYTKPTL